jgi:hypothetical protein
MMSNVLELRGFWRGVRPYWYARLLGVKNEKLAGESMASRA